MVGRGRSEVVKSEVLESKLEEGFYRAMGMWQQPSWECQSPSQVRREFMKGLDGGDPEDTKGLIK